MKGHDPSLDLIRAQVSFRLLRGDTMEAILKWWRKTYPGSDISLVYEVRDRAEKAAAAAHRFRTMPRDTPIRECF